MKTVKIVELVEYLEAKKQACPKVKTIELNISYKCGWNDALNRVILDISEDEEK